MSETTANAIAVRAIDHVTLVVADLERSRQFFAGILGMQEVPRPDFGFPGLWFQAGTTQIHLNVASDEAGTPGLTYNAGSITRALHIAFQVDDATAAAESLQSQGSRLSRDLEIVLTVLQLYILDPDGHQIEITSPPPTT